MTVEYKNAYQLKWSRTDKGKAIQKRFRQSKKRKAIIERYCFKKKLERERVAKGVALWLKATEMAKRRLAIEFVEWVASSLPPKDSGDCGC